MVSISSNIDNITNLQDEAVLERFQEDTNFLGKRVENGPLSSAFIASASVLYTWKDHPNLLEAIRNLRKNFQRVDQQPLLDELSRRLSLSLHDSTWVGCVDTAILSEVLNLPADAETYYKAALEFGPDGNVPVTRLLHSIALLKTGSFEEAESEYALAVSEATQDPPLLFRIRYEYTQALYERGSVSRTFETGGSIVACSSSTYPMEAIFGKYESLLYSWSIRDQTGIHQNLNALREILPMVQPASNSRFERRRYEESLNLLRRMESALEGDEVISMILDEEASWFDFKTSNYASIVNRLAMWKVKYPLSHYSTWDPQVRFAALSCHSAANRAAFSSGLIDEAEKGFREVIESVPVSENPELVASSHCWLGVLLFTRGELEESLKHFQDAMEVIPEQSSYRNLYRQYFESIHDRVYMLGGNVR